jgi:hypothetical protein
MRNRGDITLLGAWHLKAPPAKLPDSQPAQLRTTMLLKQ